MRKILFGLGKQVRSCSMTHEINLNKYLNNLSDKTRVILQHQFSDISNEFALQDIQNNIREANEAMANRTNKRLLKVIEMLAKTASLADAIIENYSERNKNITVENKLILAQAYASYADILYKFEPSESEKIENLVKKALKLDPKNETAVLLRFNMHFYDIVPEPKPPTI